MFVDVSHWSAQFLLAAIPQLNTGTSTQGRAIAITDGTTHPSLSLTQTNFCQTGFANDQLSFCGLYNFHGQLLTCHSVHADIS